MPYLLRNICRCERVTAWWIRYIVPYQERSIFQYQRLCVMGKLKSSDLILIFPPSGFLIYSFPSLYPLLFPLSLLFILFPFFHVFSLTFLLPLLFLPPSSLLSLCLFLPSFMPLCGVPLSYYYYN